MIKSVIIGAITGAICASIGFHFQMPFWHQELISVIGMSGGALAVIINEI